MTHKNRFLFYLTCITLLSGCGEDFTTGVTKGGTGNGVDDGRPTIVTDGDPVKDTYSIWLSKPESDYCHGLKRTLSFTDPLNSELIQENKTISMKIEDNIEYPIVLQVRWENKSDQTKTIFRSSCADLVFFDELKKDPFKLQARCDVETVTLNKNDIFISKEYKYDARYTGNKILTHTNEIQFSPIQDHEVDCDPLNIQYSIQNE